MRTEKEPLLKQLFTNIQHLTFTHQQTSKYYIHILNKGEVSAVNGTKFIILSAFFWRIGGRLKIPVLVTDRNQNINGIELGS